MFLYGLYDASVTWEDKYFTKITGTTCNTRTAWFPLLDCLCFLPLTVKYKNIPIRYLSWALCMFPCRRAEMYHLYTWKNCRQLGLTNRVCCQFVIRLRATSLTEKFFFIILSGDLLQLPCSIIRCLNSYLHLKQLIFTASAAKCCSWLRPAWLMMHSAELHNCFCANPALIYFGGFCFSLDSAWGRHGNHKQHIWQLFTSLMVKTTSPSHKSTLV